MKALRLFLLLGVFILTFGLNAHAQNINDKKAAYVDISRVFDDYERTKDYDKVLEGQHKDYEKDRNDKLEKLREKQNKLALLKEDEKAKLQAEIDKDRADLLEYDRQKQMDLRKQREDKIREILAEVEKVVKDYAQKNGYGFILNDRVLIYADEQYDITADVLKTLNENYKKK